MRVRRILLAGSAAFALCVSGILAQTTTAANYIGDTPINDLGTGYYLGKFQGGLYQNGSNVVPAAQNSQGLKEQAAVQPLSTNGQPSSAGKIVLLSIGMSNASMEWCGTDTGCTQAADQNSFMYQAAHDTAVNHKSLVIVNGAEGGDDAKTWASPTSSTYAMVASRLALSGVTAKQVEVVWLKEADIDPTVSLPSSSADAYTLEAYLGDIVRAIKTNYPNIKEVFISSRIYGGYANIPLNPEPYAYESGFAVKWLIQAQVNQMQTGAIDPIAGNLNYNTVAPWIVWAAYLWADGIIPRSDGLQWFRTDFGSDGTHPSESGILKVADQLMSFFTTSPYTSTWFNACGCPARHPS